MVNRVKEWRERRGLSQEKLAKRVKPATSGAQIHRLENDDRKLTVDWLRRLAAALDCRTWDLFEPPDQVPSSLIAGDLLVECLDGTAALYAAERQAIDERALLRKAIGIYNDVIGMAPAERAAGLKGQLAAERRWLRQQRTVSLLPELGGAGVAGNAAPSNESRPPGRAGAAGTPSRSGRGGA